MKEVLILVPGYLPGFKSGGPVRTISNMVEAIGDHFSFRVLCADRDLGDGKRYEDIRHGEWNEQGKASVFYAGNGLRGLYDLIKIVVFGNFDIFHINSFFSLRFGFIPLLFLKIFRCSGLVLIGPRGEFSEGALAIKSYKKKCFISLVRFLGLYRNVIWHASTSYEERDIRRVMGASVLVRTAIDLSIIKEQFVIPEKREDEVLGVVFVSRISRMKNLLGAIDIMRNVSSKVSFDVYGPVEDRDYWGECLVMAESLPVNVEFRYCGELLPADVGSVLVKYDLFFLPTFGENYGHVIAEALAAGLPVLISDATPWRDLSEKNIGWDIPLDKPDVFSARLESCSRISPEDYRLWRKRVQEWALENVGNKNSVDQNMRLFSDFI